MKPRPRSAEREVAKHLTELFTSHGFEAVERIPVLGRTGPDISINSIGLVVDVKSRISVPKGYFGKGTRHGDLLSIELKSLKEPIEFSEGFDYATSTTIEDWYAHMDEWTKKYKPDGITALIIHRPGMPYGKARLIIHKTDLLVLEEKLWKTKSL